MAAADLAGLEIESLAGVTAGPSCADHAVVPAEEVSLVGTSGQASSGQGSSSKIGPPRYRRTSFVTARTTR
jgi:hypothetical protein